MIYKLLYSIYSTYTGECVSVILVMVLLSYSPYFILPRTYTVYLVHIRFTLDNSEFTLDNMEFTLDNMEITWDNMTPVLNLTI